jgi:pilus assembly protein CpaE
MLGLKSNNGLVDVLQNVHRLDPQFVERTLVASGSRLFVLSADVDYGTEHEFEAGALRRVIELLCDSFHYVFVDVPEPGSKLAKEAFDLASRAYLVADRSVHATRETIRLLRYIEDRDNNPPTSVLLNNANAGATGKVAATDFMTAIGRTALHELQFEAKALAIAENLAEAPRERAPSGFTESISRIAGDLTGQQAVVERSWLQKLGLRRA